MRAGDDRVGLEIIDFVLLEKVEHALGELFGGGTRARDHLGEVETNLADLDAVFLGRAANRVHRSGGVEQRLGRDTSPIEAYSAGAVALDNSNAHLKLTRPNSGDVSAGSGADYDKVIA